MKQLIEKTKVLSVFLLVLIMGCDTDDALLPKVISSFTYTVNEDTGTVTFINISEQARTYEWDFGDGDTSTEISPVKTYTESGTYTVSLTATNNSGASATFEDDITIVIKVPITVPITFDNSNVNYNAITAFGGSSFEIVQNPDVSGTKNVVSNVGAITNVGVAFEGVFFDLGSPIDLATDKTITMNFWSEEAVSVLLKLENGTGPATEVTASHGGTGWETLTFDYSSSASFGRLTLFVDGPGTTSGTFYIDDINQESSGTVECTEETEENIDPANGDLKWTFKTNDATHTFDAFGNTSGAIVSNPVTDGINPSCNVQQFVKATGCETFAGLGYELATALDFSTITNKVFTMKVLAETQVTDVTLRLERLPFPDTEPSQDRVASITQVGEWQELTFDFSDVSTGTFKSMIIYFERNAECDGDVYYFDDIFQVSGSGGGGNAPTSSAPVPPARDAADVISIYGGTYTNISGINYDPNWGQSGFGLVNPAYDPGDGNLALAYPTFNYQGTDFSGNAQDASAMEFLHVDIWVPAGTDRQVKVSPINNGTGDGEFLVEVPLTPGAWNSVDLPISSFTGMTWDNVEQLKFDGQFNGDGSANTDPYDIYLDNIYFYKEPSTGGGNAPTSSAPAPPARDAADVISIYGGTYTNISGINYDPNWGQSGFGLVNPAYDPGDGNLALAYPSFNYQGTDFSGNAQDASAMEFLHVDIWVPTGTDRQVKVSPINGGTGVGEFLVEVPLTPGAWNSVDLPIASFTGMTWDNVVQLKFDGQFNGDGSANTDSYDIYLDNIYFYKEPSTGGGSAPTSSAPAPPARNAADVISIYGGTYSNISGINYDPNWGQSGFGLVNPAYDPGDGNLALAYPTFNYQGTDFSGNAQDASAMEFLHVDIWVPTGTDRQVKVSPINGGTGVGEFLVQVPVTPGSWNSVDLPIASFTGMTWDNVVQLKFDGQFNGDGSANTTPYDIYLDNIYFYKQPAGGGGGSSLATNGDFETGDDTGWLLFQNNGTAALDNTLSNGGSWSGRLTVGDTGGNPAFKQERIGAGTVSSGDTVQVQFDHIGTITQPGAIVNVLLFGEGAGGTVSFTQPLAPGPALTGSWTTYTGSFTIPGGADVSEGISVLIETVCGAVTGCNVVMNIDNVSVTLNP
ncbi:MAG: PKD domain-containing protein [Allomuricauda sp.]